jgi:O-antigen/teichoic acid export membrane protein
MAPYVAHNWVRVEQLSPAVVSRAIRLMGFVIALQLPFAFYQGALFGLRRHNLVNGVLIVSGTMRNAAAIAAVLLTPTLDAFFASQAAVALLQTALIAFMVWRRLSLAHHHPHFHMLILRRVWRFSTSMAANSLVGLSLTQLDKVVLSRILTLVHFGYYTLAGTVSSAVWVIIGPINSVLFPRFAQLYELRDHKGLADLYHTGSQVMAVTLLPVSITLALFAHPLIELWTQNPVVAEQAHLVASMLVVGTALNGLMSEPP